MAYWLITGSLVFDERSATAMMLAHLQTVPVPPSARVEFSMPPALDEAIMMCLEKEPAARPASAETFARLLNSCNGIGLWTPEDAENWWLINRPETAVSPDRDSNQSIELTDTLKVNQPLNSRLHIGQ